MDYRNFAIDKLKRYNALKISVDNSKTRIMELEIQKDTSTGISYEKDRVQTSSINIQEERVLSLIVEEQNEKELLRRTMQEIKQIEKSFIVLSDVELKILQKFFVNREKGHVERLMQELGYERTNVYRVKDRAVEKFTRALYGIVHI